MSDQAAFLRAICESPDDDTHRLVYADWLDDQGDSDRAEFIRAQCNLARFCPPEVARLDVGLEAGQLVPKHRRAFLKPLLDLGMAEAANRYHDGAGSGFWFTFRRGFVEEIEVFGTPAAQRFVEQAERVFAVTPLLHLRFWASRVLGRRDDETDAHDPLRLPTLATLVRLPVVGRLRTLDLRGNYLGDGAAWLLLGSPHIVPQTVLLLGGNTIGPDSEAALRERFGHCVSFEPRPVPFGDDDIPF